MGYAILLGMAWVVICNCRTLHQRIEILNWVIEDEKRWRERSIENDRVSYGRHLFALVTFRNPMKLYNFKDFG
jgi:hypothetical protein